MSLSSAGRIRYSRARGDRTSVRAPPEEARTASLTVAHADQNPNMID